MRASKVFLATVLFFGLFAGGQTFMGDLWSSHDIDSNTSLTARQNYKQVQQDLNGNNNSLRSKIETLSSDKGGVLDAASAGLLFVPQVVDVLVTPITALLGTLSSVSNAFTVFLPGWAATLIEMIIVSTIIFAILSLVLGVKT